MKLHLDDIIAPEKAVIIPDSNFFYAMACAEVAQTPEPDTHSLNLGQAMLSYLGRHGFTVLIPWMVAHETYRILNAKVKSRDVFDTAQRDESTTLREQQAPWMHKVCAGKIPAVYCLTHPVPDHIEAYQTKNIELGNRLENSNASGIDKGAQQLEKRNIKRDLINMAKQSTRHFGEQACEELINALPKNTPVFYLSKDRERLENIERYCPRDQAIGELPISKLNLRGFVYGFSDNAQHFGIRMNDSEFVYALLNQNQKISGNTRPITKVAIDSSNPYCGEDTVQNYPFRELMRTVEFPALQKENEEELAEEKSAKVTSRTDRFEERFGKNWAEKSGLKRDNDKAKAAEPPSL